MNRRAYLKEQGIVIGGLLFSASLISHLQSCSPSSKNSSYKLLSIDEAKAISELAEMIIPRTDTPGAMDLNIASRIDEALYFNYERGDHVMFLEGIREVDNLSNKMKGKPFLKLNESEKRLIMDRLLQESKKSIDPMNIPIFTMLKGLTIVAYFTSPTIMQEVLLFDPIPSDFEGDIPFDEVGGMWSL